MPVSDEPINIDFMRNKLKVGKKSFGKVLKAARTKSGLSQETVANKLGVTQPTISALEIGRFLPSERLMLKTISIFKNKFSLSKKRKSKNAKRSTRTI